MCYFFSRRKQAAVGNLAQELHDSKANASTVGTGGGLSAAGQSAEMAIKVEPSEVPPMILRKLQRGLRNKFIIDPTVQFIGQNKKDKSQTFSIASRAITDGFNAAKSVLREVMPIDQANKCMVVYSPKEGVSAQKLS